MPESAKKLETNNDRPRSDERASVKCPNCGDIIVPGEQHECRKFGF